MSICRITLDRGPVARGKDIPCRRSMGRVIYDHSQGARTRQSLAPQGKGFRVSQGATRAANRMSAEDRAARILPIPSSIASSKAGSCDYDVRGKLGLPSATAMKHLLKSSTRIRPGHDELLSHLWGRKR